MLSSRISFLLSVALFSLTCSFVPCCRGDRVRGENTLSSSPPSALLSDPLLDDPHPIDEDESSSFRLSLQESETESERRRAWSSWIRGDVCESRVEVFTEREVEVEVEVEVSYWWSAPDEHATWDVFVSCASWSVTWDRIVEGNCRSPTEGMWRFRVRVHREMVSQQSNPCADRATRAIATWSVQVRERVEEQDRTRWHRFAVQGNHPVVLARRLEERWGWRRSEFGIFDPWIDMALTTDPEPFLISLVNAGIRSKSLIMNHFPSVRFLDDKESMQHLLEEHYSLEKLDSFSPRTVVVRVRSPHNTRKQESDDRKRVDGPVLFSFQFQNSTSSSENRLALAREFLCSRSVLGRRFDSTKSTLRSKSATQKTSGWTPEQPLVSCPVIVKPSNSSRARGIEVFESVEDSLPYMVNLSIRGDQSRSSFGPYDIIPDADSFVLQEYIRKPLLIWGRKFDIRLLVLVTSLNPLVSFVYEDFVVRISNEHFLSSNYTNRLIHLTNAALQLHHLSMSHSTLTTVNEFDLPPFVSNQTSVVLDWTRSSLEFYLQNEFQVNFSDLIWPQILKIVSNILRVWKDPEPFASSFEVLGFDILIDENFQAFFIEVNQGPLFGQETRTKRKLYEEASDGILDIILGSAKFDRNLCHFESKEPFGSTIRHGKWKLHICRNNTDFASSTTRFHDRK